MKRVVYLAGPMTGLPEFNYPRFNEVAAKLREEEIFVYNPAEYCKPEAFRPREAFAEFLTFICLFTTELVLLEGWESSKGANIERDLAELLGIKITEWKDWNNG